VRSRILLSFSTTVMDDQEALIERAVAATADRDAVLTTGDADHDALLPECAAVVTHGGLGTTLRALAHGVPLLMLPLGRDQPANAMRVAELGAGIALDAGATAEQIRAGVAQLVTQPGFAAAAAGLAERIAAAEADDRAVAALVSAASS
jgi:UDP:flavonoid glycosyltransferase YjiC (YdhE family)